MRSWIFETFTRGSLVRKQGKKCVLSGWRRASVRSTTCVDDNVSNQKADIPGKTKSLLPSFFL